MCSHCYLARVQSSLFRKSSKQAGGPKDPLKCEDIISKGHPREHSQSGDPEPLTSRVKFLDKKRSAKCQIQKAVSEEQWVDAAAFSLILTSVCPSNPPPDCPQVSFLRQASLCPENKPSHGSPLPPIERPKLFNMAHKPSTM